MAGPSDFLTGPFDGITREGGVKGAAKGAGVGAAIGACWVGAMVIGGAVLTGGLLAVAAAVPIIGAMRGAMRKKPKD